jgi:hypothetical protein
MPRLKLSNNALTTLAETVAIDATSFDVTDGSVFTETPCRMTIYETDPAAGEIIEVGNVSGNTLSSVQRGLEGTSAQEWAAGMKIAILGTAGTYNELVSDDDSRLSDAREPTAHKNTHATGGSDALSPSDIGAAESGHSHNAADVSYDNTDSGLTATDVKAGIDEISGSMATMVVQNIEAEHWIRKADTPANILYADGTNYDGIGYLFAKNNAFYKYDAQADEWSSVPGTGDSNLDAQPGIVGYNGYIYIIGGAGNNSTLKCWKYEISTQTHTQITTIPYAYGTGYYIAVCEYGGIIYAGGGREGFSPSGNGTTNSFYKYDPVGDTWTQLNSISQGSGYYDFAVLNDKIYAVNKDGEIAIFNPSTETWTNKSATTGTGYSNPLAIALDSYIYIFQFNANNDYALAYRYDPSEDSATRLDDSNYNHIYSSGFLCSTNDTEEPNKIYLAGGLYTWYELGAYTEEFNINPAISQITSPLSGIVRWSDNTIEGVTKDSSLSPSSSGTAIFIGTTS